MREDVGLAVVLLTLGAGQYGYHELPQRGATFIAAGLVLLVATGFRWLWYREKS